MKPLRIDYMKTAPGALKGMFATNAYLDEASIPQSLRRLVELRVSQINGCGYCIWLHTKQARDLGETNKRIAAVADWRSADCFDSSEIAAFDWADAVTRIASGTPSDTVYNSILNHFDARQVVELTATVANMNALNRMAISFRDEPPDPE